LKKRQIIEKPREVLPAGTKDEDFFSRVYDVVRLIPPGRVTSYGAIARFLGSGRSARMVGWAMNACHHVQPPVPAHRVVNRNGQLSILDALPSLNNSPVDVSGAGDTVISVATLCMAAGIPKDAIAAFSNLAGGLACEKVGVVPVDKQQLLDEILRLS
jgi:alkylated DNA nucleotide flippase Atl1